MKDYRSEVGKLWLKKFKKAKPTDQYKLENLLQETYPTKPAREREKELPKEPMQREREIEYRDLIKKKNKSLRDRTA